MKTDNDREKSANFKAAIEENGKDVKLELKTSLMPDFIATFSKRDLIYKKASGHKIDAVVQLFKDFKYELEYAVSNVYYILDMFVINCFTKSACLFFFLHITGKFFCCIHNTLFLNGLMYEKNRQHHITPC